MSAYVGPLETDLEPDDYVMFQFLSWWFEKCNHGVVELCWRDPATGGWHLIRRFGLDDINAASRFAAETNARPGCSVYFRPATVRFDTLHTTDADIVQIPGLWSDYDNSESVDRLHAIQWPRPSAEVVTGRIPALRVQALWKSSGDPILVGEWVRELNRSICTLTGGDPAVVNPSSLMRLPGSIAWPWKPGREPELTEWVTPDGGGGTFTLDALRAALPAVEAEPLPNGRATAGTGTSELLNPVRALIERVKAGPVWHEPALRLVAMLVARGTPSCVIEALAPELTWPGYTVQQTRAELATMIAGAHRKGFAPEEGEPVDGADDTSDVEAEVMNVPPNAAPEPTPETIDGDWWIARELTRPVPVLGEVICASTRALIGGPTGAGKTHLAMAMAGAIATSRGFLHWPGPAAPLAVLYIDGEMARDLIQDRMRDLQRRLGGVSLANLHMLCREDFPAMQGLNTPPGRAFVLAAVEHLKPSVIFLDSRMCLLVGDMKDEIPWTETMPLVWALTRLQVAQIWLDHTGHDGGHIYGSKTKEWQMDLVGIVEEANDPSADIAMKLRWTKARRRRPETRADFSPGIITLHGDEWLWIPDETGTRETGGKRSRMSDDTELLRRAINTLASDPSVTATFVPETSFPVRGVSRGIVLKAHLITSGWFIETSDYVGSDAGRNDPTAALTDKGRDRPRNSLNTLKRLGLCGFNREFVWPVC